MRVSTPAKPPKVRGKSPGWKTEKPRKRRIKYLQLVCGNFVIGRVSCENQDFFHRTIYG